MHWCPHNGTCHPLAQRKAEVLTIVSLPNSVECLERAERRAIDIVQERHQLKTGADPLVLFWQPVKANS